MATSYGTVGVECSVAEFDALAQSGQVGQAWKNYCDCMFLEPMELVEFYSGNTLIRTCQDETCLGQEVGQKWYVAGNQKNAADFTSQYAAQRGEHYWLRAYVVGKRTPDWVGCMNVFCAAPGGCLHPDFPEIKVPFNVAPGILFAPWTDVGAGARQIKKRDASFAYTMSQFFTIDLKQYEPLNLWKYKFTNPALYQLLLIKVAFIPGIGASLSAALSQSSPFDAIALFPLAIAQCALEGKNPIDEVFKQLLKGGVKNLQIAGKTLGAFMGAQYFELAGAMLQTYAQDQIDSGEIDKILDPLTNGVIRFAAASGEELGRAVQKTMVGAANASMAVTVCTALEAGFRAIANSAQAPDDVRSAMKIATNAMRVIRRGAEAYVTSIENHNTPTDTALNVADAITDSLFGIKITALIRATAQGVEAVNALLADAKRQTGEGTIEGLQNALNDITKAIDVVAKVINDFAAAVGGGLEKFQEQFTVMQTTVADVQNNATSALNAAGIVVHPAVSVSVPAFQTGVASRLVNGSRVVATVANNTAKVTNANASLALSLNLGSKQKADILHAMVRIPVVDAGGGSSLPLLAAAGVGLWYFLGRK